MKTMIFKPFDVVELPFPFSDLSSSKKRKALVISSEEFNKKNNACAVIMITSRSHSEWVGDVEIKHWARSGLKKTCYVRLKFFTADMIIFSGKIGTLMTEDKKSVSAMLKKHLPF
jgi:mRNA interferase MazF